MRPIIGQTPSASASPWATRLDVELQVSAPPAPALDSLAEVTEFRRLLDSKPAGRLPQDAVTTVDRPLGERGTSVRRYTPEVVSFATQVVYLHAGGFVAGSVRASDVWARRVCAQAGAVVWSVDYSLAPQDPYPSALDDVTSVIEAVAASTGRPVVLVGDSAGGGVAAAATLRARDMESDVVGFLCVTNPALDDRLQTQSAKQFVDTPLWNAGAARASWAHYLRSTAAPGAVDVPTYAAPGRADDLVGMPPTFVMVSHLDPLRDEGIEFARALLAAHVATELHLFPGTFHGSRTMAHAEVSQAMAGLCVRAIRRALVALTSPTDSPTEKEDIG